MDTFGRMTELGHERVCFHHDAESGLRAIIAIHSTKLGPALGGTRRWCYATEEEALYDVMRLSESMSCKAACAGLPMGGCQERHSASRAKLRRHRSRGQGHGSLCRHIQWRLHRS